VSVDDESSAASFSYLFRCHIRVVISVTYPAILRQQNKTANVIQPRSGARIQPRARALGPPEM